jgi:hypothetical protein
MKKMRPLLQAGLAYEAHIYIGYDNASDRYVIHWIDIFGGRFSEILGYGTRSGNSIKFVFEYPDGPFHNTFTWNSGDNSWRFFLEQKGADGNGNRLPIKLQARQNKKMGRSVSSSPV